MCGIAGLFAGSPSADQELVSIVREMTDALHHRGPDGHGIWIDAASGIVFGHRRLSIIDLSSEGRQPMTSRSGRYTVTFNGEVYNFRQLRSELEFLGHDFRGHSDTEVMLAAIEQWGLRSAVGRFVGMFSFAVWDRQLARLSLVRDRLGKKPLYYGQIDGRFHFGSELKALIRVPGFEGSIDRSSLALYLRFNCVPAPHSIYAGIYKLTPATILHVERASKGGYSLTRDVYWTPPTAQLDQQSSARVPSLQDSADALENLLKDAVAKRLESDVPLGAFLSGGVDSSVVVALMQQLSSRPVRTFTIGFHEGGYNEAEKARGIAGHLKTNHTELYVTPRDSLEVIPRLPDLYDEPFSDSSQIPTFLVSKLARSHVTVALSGDGGDELFCGYNRYVWWRKVWGGSRRVPPFAREYAARVLRSLPAETWNCLAKWPLRALPAKFRDGAPGEKLHKLADVLTSSSPDKLYYTLVSHWQDPSRVVLGSHEPRSELFADSGILDLDRFTERMMRLDTLTYLPDDVLTKVDRASMGVSLEVRCPLLDHRLFEFNASLPLSYKLANTTSKVILKKVLSKHVPESLWTGPKAGFAVPIGAWLRGPLREWSEDLLNTQRLSREGYFDPGTVRRLWDSHMSGRVSSPYLLWDILMFQAWLARWGR